ncbi:DUF2975 domain-containing protein [Streptomyces polyrhachis]|uniref:DUF2975 domain-containing protein n=1 Tax=Streptomyces polyrhachis TaxID=1282885 RepID=A0ABW2GF00_9ACTN
MAKRTKKTPSANAGARLLEPVATVIRGAYRLAVFVLVLQVAVSVVDTGLHGPWSSPYVCADDPSTFFDLGDFGTGELPRAFGPLPGIGVSASPTYCTDHPDAAQRFYDLAGDASAALLLFGVLFLLNRMIQTATRDGVFTHRPAHYLRLTGWWLLLGSLAVEVVQTLTHAALLATLARDYEEWGLSWNAPYTLILTALGILAFARVLRAGAAMREDLEGTV